MQPRRAAQNRHDALGGVDEGGVAGNRGEIAQLQIVRADLGEKHARVFHPRVAGLKIYVRLRVSGSSEGDEVKAIGVAAEKPRREVDRQVLEHGVVRESKCAQKASKEAYRCLEHRREVVDIQIERGNDPVPRLFVLVLQIHDIEGV